MKYLGTITDNKDLVNKEYVDTADASKQDTLVSGTNIKTINNESLLGSGNISIGGGGTVDTAMSDSSENAVQNKVIKAYVDSVPTLDYTNAYSSGQTYKKTGLTLAGSTYLGQDIKLGSKGTKYPIFNGFDISGTGTARIHTLGHYIYKSGSDWYAYVKMRNDNTSAISNFTVVVYIAWI